MKKIIFPMAAALVSLAACNGSGNDMAEVDGLRDEAIAVHDEIMPQVSAFDRNTVKIDSLLSSLSELHVENPDIDTLKVREDLSALRSQLEGATDAMMDWMTDFDLNPQDKTVEEIKTYYEEQVEKVKELKTRFDEVAKKSTEKLAQF